MSKILQQQQEHLTNIVEKLVEIANMNETEEGEEKKTNEEKKGGEEGEEGKEGKEGKEEGEEEGEGADGEVEKDEDIYENINKTMTFVLFFFVCFILSFHHFLYFIFFRGLPWDLEEFGEKMYDFHSEMWNKVSPISFVHWLSSQNSKVNTLDNFILLF